MATHINSIRYKPSGQLNRYVNGYIPTVEFDRDLQCPNDDEMNDDLNEGPRKNYVCGPDCPGHPCKYQCGKQLHAQQFQQHKLECPNIPVTCNAAKYCPWYVISHQCTM